MGPQALANQGLTATGKKAGQEVDPCSLSTVITLLHRSGLALLSLNENTNQITWLENDVIGSSTINTIQPTTQLQIPSLSSPTPTLLTQAHTGQNHGGAAGILHQTHRDNDDYSVSQLSLQLRRKVEGTIYSIEILTEILLPIFDAI